MFHVKHLVNQVRQIQVDHLFFYLFLFALPFQVRYIFNPADAYIGYVFSYQKAIFFYLSDLLFVGAVSGWFLFFRPKTSMFWPILLPILWALTYLFHVEHQSLAFYAAIKIAQFWLIVIFIKENPRIIQSSLKVVMVSGILQALIAIGQFHVQHGLNLTWLGEYVPLLNDSGTATLSSATGKILRSYGTMPHPNVLGGFLAIALGILLYVSRETHKLKDWIIVSCGTFILSWGLIVSFSRSAWIAAFLASVIFISSLIIQKRLKQAIIYGILLIVSCGTLGLIYKDLVFPRTLDMAPNSQASQYRQSFNSYGYETLKNNGWIGTGPGQYISKMESTYDLEPWQYQPPHNIFLLYAVETGLIGVLVLFITLFWLGFTWNKLYVLQIMLVISVFALGMLDHYLLTIQQGFLLLAFCLGVVLANKKDVSRLRETS